MSFTERAHRGSGVLVQRGWPTRLVGIVAAYLSYSSHKSSCKGITCDMGVICCQIVARKLYDAKGGVEATEKLGRREDKMACG